MCCLEDFEISQSSCLVQVRLGRIVGIAERVGTSRLKAFYIRQKSTNDWRELGRSDVHDLITSNGGLDHAIKRPALLHPHRKDFLWRVEPECFIGQPSPLNLLKGWRELSKYQVNLSK